MERFVAELEAYLTATGLKDYELTAAEQKALEEKWIADLNKKYPVTVNWNLLKRLGK